MGMTLAQGTKNIIQIRQRLNTVKELIPELKIKAAATCNLLRFMIGVNLYRAIYLNIAGLVCLCGEHSILE